MDHCRKNTKVAFIPYARYIIIKAGNGEKHL